MGRLSYCLGSVDCMSDMMRETQKCSFEWLALAVTNIGSMSNIQTMCGCNGNESQSSRIGHYHTKTAVSCQNLFHSNDKFFKRK